jgi:DHA1 family tetracycline resistance protein-like MFS transporter
MGLAEPTMKSLMSRSVAETEQGQLQGAMQSLASLAGITGPVFFGWVYAVSAGWMPGLSFVIGAAVLMIAAGVVGISARRHPLTSSRT